ncbi:unannotated protein [freshwater metagenome]|uniref:Unannotated protein n=1 Tax=freshwater metagenome TaxID=449393 RepID=A0A6J7UT94_9ZZZZ
MPVALAGELPLEAGVLAGPCPQRQEGSQPIA